MEKIKKTPKTSRVSYESAIETGITTEITEIKETAIITKTEETSYINTINKINSIASNLCDNVKRLTKRVEHFTEDTINNIDWAGIANKFNIFGQTICNGVKAVTSKMEENGELLVEKAIQIYDEIDESKISFNNRKLMAPVSFALSFMLIATIVTGNFAYEKAYAAYSVFYGDEKVATVKNIDEFNATVSEIEKALSEEQGITKRLDKEFTYEETIADFDELSSNYELELFVEKETADYGYGYIMEINGQRMALVKNKDVVNEALLSLVSEYVPKEDRDSATTVENITYSEAKIYDGQDMDAEKLASWLMKNQKEVKYHTIEVGESLAFISEMYKIPMSTLLKYNPNFNSKTVLEQGQKVKLTEEPVVTIGYSKTVEYEKAVGFETEVVKDDNMYVNKKYTKTEGVEGKNKVVELRKFENGVQVSAEIQSETVVQEPTTKIVVQGTKALPKYVATGAFMTPTRGRFTSGFGRRWGRMHKGIDLAGSYGTPIKAADSGKVVFAGWYYGLGKMVKINHGNGFETVYGHLSSINVKVGQKVLKGEKLGGMGSTGRSTGVHLHFEVIKNGVHQNPMKYLK